MRKSKIIDVLVIGLSFLPLVTLAQQDNVTPIAANVLGLARVLVTLVFVLSVVAFGWGIVRFVMAAGNPEEVKKAKAFLLWGVVGMAVGASIFGLIQFLRTYFGIQGGQLILAPPVVQ